MITYNSKFNPPRSYSPQQRADALAGLQMQSPYAAYGQNQQDILDAVGGANAAAFDAQASKSDADRMRAQQALALAGLQQMAQAEGNQRQAAASRFGAISPLLQGLFS